MDKYKFLGGFILSSLIFFFSSSLSLAQTTPTIGANLSAYVPPTGSECNINVPSQYPTIQAGIDAANPGDTVCVGQGTYSGDLRIIKPLRLSGSGFDKSILKGSGSAGSYTILAGHEGEGENNVTIEGFTIYGNPWTDYTTSAIRLWFNSSNSVVRYNYIVPGSDAVALIVEQSNTLVQNNVLEGNNSFLILNVGTSTENVNVVNNTFTGSSGLRTQYGGTVFYFGSKNGLISQNVFNTSGPIFQLLVVEYSSNIVNENNFNSLTDYWKLWNSDSDSLNAEHNWWGAVPPMQIVGNVDYSLYATSPFPEYPVPSLNQSPVANAGPGQTVDEGQQVTFDGSGSTDPDGVNDIVGYSWDFGDGGTASGVLVNHIYSQSGAYTATLTVTDSQGATSTDIALVTVNHVRKLINLFPAQVWIGLKNSDDVGVKFDLLAEIYKNGTELVDSAELDHVSGGSSGFNNAHLRSIPLSLSSPIVFPEGSGLSIKVYVRNTCFGGTHNSGVARLWFNDSAANSLFGAQIDNATNNYYLLDNFLLSTLVGSGPKKYIDIQSGSPCSAWKPFGSWAVTP